MPALFFHYSPDGFAPRWIEYCKKNSIAHQVIDVYSSDFWSAIRPGDILMWHYTPTDSAAEQILKALELSGVHVFPNASTRFGFDDKLSQALLGKVSEVPYAKTEAILSKAAALDHIRTREFPVVFKLSKGTASLNVKLLEDTKQAQKLVMRMFSSGIREYNALGVLKWRVYQLFNGHIGISKVLSAVVRLFFRPSSLRGRERGYIIFQDFIPENAFDRRIVVVDGRAFGFIRQNRPNDFRASSSGLINYDPEKIPSAAVKQCLDTAKLLKSDSCAFDLLQERSGEFRIIEICYGFTPWQYDGCPGYWDSNLNWRAGEFDPYGWMVELMLLKQRNMKGETNET
jgi:glutathione synthase/RimK-type ligase-like ATP-grasp enzyme